MTQPQFSVSQPNRRTVRGRRFIVLLGLVGALLVSGCEVFRVATLPVDAIGGIWMEIAMKDGLLTVISTQENTPAFRAGLLPGDIITEIDGKETQKMSFNTASLKICGRAGTGVRFKSLRPSTQEVKECTLIREDLAQLNARTAAAQRGQEAPAASPAPPAATPATLLLPTESATPF